MNVVQQSRMADRGCGVSLVFLIALLACSSSLLSGCKGGNSPGHPVSAATIPSVKTQSPVVPNPPKLGDPSADLRAIGGKVAAAVLAKDTKTLLMYDRDDLRAQDEESLRDEESDLYGWLFDSDSEATSVYEKLSSAHDLGIKTFVAKSPANGRTYGTLVFYDRARIPEKSLESDTFLCKEKSLVSWGFELKGWKMERRNTVLRLEDGRTVRGIMLF